MKHTIHWLTVVCALSACGQTQGTPGASAQQTILPATAVQTDDKKTKAHKKAPKCSVKAKDATSIFNVQGDGPASPLAGQAVTIQGVVVGDFQNTDQLGGFFVQDFEGDNNPLTSDAVFVYAPTAADVKPGEYVQLTGTVKEFNGATQIDTLTALEVCGADYAVTPTAINLPIADADFERFEGMLVTFPQTLTVTEVYGLGRYGEIALSSHGRLFNPTNGNTRYTQAENNARRILLDDGSTRQNPSPTPYMSASGPAGTRRVGDTVTNVTGVLGYSFNAYRIQPVTQPQFVIGNPRTERPKDVNGTLKVASFNVLNYFTDFGQRGASNAEEFARQKSKIIAAIKAIDADVLGLIEMQNNGDVALNDLLGALNTAYGADTYRAIMTGKIGTDAIKQAIIYKHDRVNPVDQYQIDTNPILDRPTLAQTFQQTNGHGVFTLAVSHFKSKGSCPTSGDTDQGQGCWNQKRIEQARALVAFTEKLKETSGDADVLAMGDLNAYGAEDPITLLEQAGFESLNKRVPAEDRYSYVFNGQSGYLDHALATPNLGGQVTGITEWHINSDEPVILDYNKEFKTDDRFAPTPYRSSDHDPVVVGLNLSADPVRSAPPTLSITVPSTAQAGQSVTVSINAQSSSGKSITSLEVNWGDGRTDMLASNATSASHVYTNSGRYELAVSATDSGGQTATQKHSIEVTAQPAPGASKLVISQVYGGGGNNGAQYRNDFVELFNAGSAPVSLAGMTVQYASATGTFNGSTSTTALPERTLAPGQYFLIQLGAGSNTAAPALPAPDVSGTTAVASASGKIALVRNADNITGRLDEDVLDFVGFGSVNDSEGSPVGGLSNTTSAHRNQNGCQDTDENSADFTIGAPAPRNSASDMNPCP